MRGFSLIEMMLALIILTFGLLTVGQLLYVVASSSSLARSQGTAAIAAQGVLESLASLYSQNPSAADLAIGAHGLGSKNGVTRRDCSREKQRSIEPGEVQLHWDGVLTVGLG